MVKKEFIFRIISAFIIAIKCFISDNLSFAYRKSSVPKSQKICIKIKINIAEITLSLIINLNLFLISPSIKNKNFR
jgi:hypothetical protein